MEIIRKPGIKKYQIYLIIAGLLVSGIIYSCDRFSFFPRRTHIEGIALDGMSFEKLTGATVTLKPSEDSSATTTGQVTIDDTGSEIFLGSLNPDNTQLLDERAALPQTSGGFNQAPVWRFEEFDLGSFAGPAIRLKFVFDTRDHRHNGFRGWFIDEIKVVERDAQITFSADLPQPAAR